jgi:hypothetical protein
MNRGVRRFGVPAVCLGALLVVGSARAAQACDNTNASWANRDDDGDGVCNGVDNCPYEPNPSQNASACAMSAITVPWVPGNSTFPHSTYSGASIVLKGIARYGGDQYMWTFGDGSAPMAWTAIGNAFNLGVAHTYTGDVGRLFVPVLSVRNSGNPGYVVSSSYFVQIQASSDLSDPNQLNVRANMAIDQSLWYLHINQSRAQYADGANGYNQTYGYWESLAATCGALDAFQLHGSKPLSDSTSDPYVETTRRALNYIFAQAQVVGTPGQQYGNPDTNGNGIGIRFGPDDSYTNGICGLAVASSGAPGRVAGTGPGSVYNRAYFDITQDMVDYFAWAQNDGSNGYQGGWYYSANSTSADGSTNQWPILAMSAAVTNMSQLGLTVPLFVKQQIPNFSNTTHYLGMDNDNGGWGYVTAAQLTNSAKTAGGMLSHYFTGDSANQIDVQKGLGFLYRHWNDSDGSWSSSLGYTYAMYGIMKAMRTPNPPLSRVYDFNYNAGVQSTNSFDWYYTPSGQAQQGLGTYLVTHQSADGSWTDTTGARATAITLTTAWDTLILGKGVTVVSPTAKICNCSATWAVNSPVTLDGTCSTDPDSSKIIRQYDWDFAYNGTSFNATPVAGYANTQGLIVDQAGFPSYTQDRNGVPNGTVYTVALRVTDNTSAAAGGPLTSITTCNVNIKPPPHCPNIKAGGPYLASLNTPITFDASASYDIDNDPITYKWDLQNNSQFADGAGVQLTHTFATAGTFPIAVQGTDHPELNAVPYSAPDCSVVDYTTVEVGSHNPIASPGGPYTSVPNNTITLDGSKSWDPDGLPLTYAWDLQGNGLYTDSTAIKPNFTVGNVAAGTSYTVCLRVSNGTKSGTACSTVGVIKQQTPPTCSIVSPTVVASCTGAALKIQIDGSRSSDDNGNSLTYAWTSTCPVPFDNASASITNLTFQTLNEGCNAGCTATLTINNGYFSTSCNADIKIVDNLPPTYTTTPSNTVIECNASATANVNAWLANAAAVDSCAGAGTSVSMSNNFAANGGCGGVGVGNTVSVTWSAQDVCSATAIGQKTATVSVVDTTPPTLSLPANIIAEATGPAGRTVTFAATASDFVSGSPAVTCTPASGSTFGIGVTTVNCTTKDGANNTANGSFTVTVRDTTPPALTLPANIVAEATGAPGRVVSYVASALDIVDGARAVSCAPASGSTFAIGVTTVNCTSSDTRSNTAVGSFTVTVGDTTPPTVTVPSNMIVEATKPTGAVVTFTSTASDLVDGPTSVTCSPASGSTFSIAATTPTTTTVTCTSKDAHNNTGSNSFTVTVRDTTAPTFAGPPTTAPITLEASGPSGTLLTNYNLSASDIVDGVTSVVCTPALPQTFKIGTTGISCTSTDQHANVGSLAFNVVVRDTTPPNIICPSDLTVMANGRLGAENWGAPEPTSTALAAFFAQASTNDLVDPAPALLNNSPLLFPSGATTTVTFTATDSYANRSTCTARVTVNFEVEPPTALTCPANMVLSNGSGLEIDWSIAFRRPVHVEMQVLDGPGPLTLSELAYHAVQLTTGPAGTGNYAVLLRATDEITETSVECTRFISPPAAGSVMAAGLLP